jgi:TolA-binding protein
VPAARIDQQVIDTYPDTAAATLATKELANMTRDVPTSAP